MHTPPPAAQWALIVVTGFLLAGGAVFLTASQGDPISPLFRNAVAIQVVAGLLLWSVLGWAARRIIVGKVQEVQVLPPVTLLLGGSRIALLIAVVTAMVCWLVALVMGLALAAAFVRAVVLLGFISVFTTIFGGALVNSVMAVRQWRER